MKYFFVYLLLINAAGFLLMLADKQKAIKKQWRISERTLILTAILGGSIGSLTGMLCFRHKTQHLKFTLGLPLILTAQTAAITYVLYLFLT